MRHAGATGQLTMRADSGFYTHSIGPLPQDEGPASVPACAISLKPYPTRSGGPSPTDCGRDHLHSQPDAAPVRLIVRRVKPTPGSQLASSPPTAHASSPTGTGRFELEADHRRRSKTPSDLKYGVGLNHLPSGRFAANAAWLAVQVLAHNLARWTARIGLGEQSNQRPCGDASSPWSRTHPTEAPTVALGNPVQCATAPHPYPPRRFRGVSEFNTTTADH